MLIYAVILLLGNGLSPPAAKHAALAPWLRVDEPETNKISKRLNERKIEKERTVTLRNIIATATRLFWK